MVSAIDPTKPADGVPAEKADLRANLQAAKDEIEALQAAGGGSGSIPPGVSNSLLGYDASTDPANVTIGANLTLSNNVLSAAGGGSGGTYLRTEGGGVSRSVLDHVKDIGYNPKDFGAIADGTLHPLSERYGTLGAAQADFPFVTALTESIDWAALQRCCDLATANLASGKVYVPQGDYVINQTVRLTKSKSPAGTYYGIHFEGAGTGFLELKRGTVIRCVSTMNDRPMLDATSARPCYIGNITILGPITGQQPASYPNPDFNRSAYIIGGAVDGRQNAQIGLSIDGFDGTKPTASWPVPSSWWTNTENASEHVIIENVSVDGHVIGLGLHCGAGYGQGDNVNVYNYRAQRCAYAVSVGNSQARGENFFGGRIDHCHTAFTGCHHGNQHKGSFNVVGMEFDADSVIAYCDTSNASHAFINCEFEHNHQLLYTEGQQYGINVGTNSVPTFRNNVLFINGRWRAYEFTNVVGSPVLCRLRGGGVKFVNFMFDWYGVSAYSGNNSMFAVNFVGSGSTGAPNVDFDNCCFLAADTASTGSRPQILFVGVHPAEHPTPSFQSCNWLKPGGSEGPPNQLLVSSRVEAPRTWTSRIFAHYGCGMIQDRRGHTYAPYWPIGYSTSPSMVRLTISGVTFNAGARTITFTPGDSSLLQVGDIITWRTKAGRDFAVGADDVLVLRVTSAGATVTCAMGCLAADLDATFTGPVYIAMVPFTPTATTRGDGLWNNITLTSGSGSTFQVGDWIDAQASNGSPAGLAANTRITNIAGSVLTLNKNVTSSFTNARIGGPVRFQSTVVTDGSTGDGIALGA